MLYVIAINNAVKNAGTASSKISHLISLKLEAIITPTIINAGAVAALGIIVVIGYMKIHNKKNIAVKKLVKPVLPPASIPAALSTYVVVFDVPNNAPILVAIESANNAFSIFVLKPFESSIASMSSCLNTPLLSPVPINVPIVSNVSDKLNAKIARKARSILSIPPENNVPIPSNAAKNVVPISLNGANKLLKSIFEKLVTPIGQPIIVVTTIPIRIAPLTFVNNKTTVIIIPINANTGANWLKSTIAGTAEESPKIVPNASVQ